MRDVNKVILRGVVSDAPQSRMVGDGTRKLVNLTVKTVTMESDDEGALRERPAWHRVDVWGDKFGEIAERLAPDHPVYVEGKLRTRSWERDGEKNYMTTVVADIVREAEDPDPQVNRGVFVGNLGADPELREFPNFTVLNFRMAMSEGWTSRTGASQEHTEWLQVSAFGDQARRLHTALSKGERVFAEGMLTTRKWQGQDGRERRTLELRPRTVSGSGGRKPGDRGARPERDAMRDRLESRKNWDDSASGVDTNADEDDVIPF